MNYTCDPSLYWLNPQLLELLREAIGGEREDRLFYQFLINEAPNQYEKEIIKSIQNDEIKHNMMFRSIYTNLTGTEIEPDNSNVFNKPDNYIRGLEQALFGELAAVEKYRKIRVELPCEYQRDMLFEIITDELKHSSKYNYLFTLNMTQNMR
ncbi:ferritin family protein [Terribacillus saccharophilus]|uniref:ferritin family protein n=1 Tax=Terribacillus saccharophilus TaxID=361277 RepID=UPI003D29AAD6